VSAPVLELAGVQLAYRREPVVRDASLHVDAGETVALVGPSGSGKSSLVRLVLGLVAPTRGTIQIGGRVASEAGRIVLAPERRGLAVVFQDLALWPHLTVERNLAFALAARGRPAADPRAWLDRVGLADKARRYPGELSGGERQRVAIARALVTEPAAVLLDEPLASLDVALADELRALFRTLLADRSVLYVTHDPREIAELADRVVVLEAGSVVQTGTPADLRERPATRFVERIARDLAPPISPPPSDPGA
jgi:iron(III) transport system ATP-binding protein